MTEYIIDIILAGIFIAMTAVYFRRGFAKTILKFVSFFLSIVFSRALSGSVMDWVLENTSLFTGTERYITKLIITVLTFVVVSAALNALVVLVNKFFKIPVLKQANKLLGGLLGALCGGIIVIVLCFAFQITSHVMYKTDFAQAVENSKIVQFVLSDEKVNEGIASFKIMEG
jgi:uncharacterized membrane protein required for colicin V production